MAQRILVVDDDQYLRDIYEETLRDGGFDVEICTNGEEGLARLQAGGIDLCLLDMMLPKVDGLGVLDYMRQHPPVQPNGPIIILTNLSHEKLISDAMERGAATYLVKADLTPDVLLAEVKKHVRAETPQA